MRNNVSMETVKNSTFERVIAAAGIGVIGVGVYILREFNPVTAGFFPQCLFFQLTGFHCPGCGLTRGFHALFHGEIFAALDYNVLLPFYFAFALIILVSLFLTVWRGFGLSITFIKPWFLWTFLGISLTFGILRNIPIYPLYLLAP
jgi:hypothetical protein